MRLSRARLRPCAFSRTVFPLEEPGRGWPHIGRRVARALYGGAWVPRHRGQAGAADSTLGLARERLQGPCSCRAEGMCPCRAPADPGLGAPSLRLPGSRIGARRTARQCGAKGEQPMLMNAKLGMVTEHPGLSLRNQRRPRAMHRLHVAIARFRAREIPVAQRARARGHGHERLHPPRARGLGRIRRWPHQQRDS